MVWTEEANMKEGLSGNSASGKLLWAQLWRRGTHLLRFNLVCLVFLLFFGLNYVQTAQAATHWIEGTQSKQILSILADPQRNRVYYGDAETNQIVVVDSEGEAVITRIQLAGKPLMMDISKDGQKLAVACSGLAIVDLETFQVTQLPVNLVISSVAFDFAGQLYVTTGDSWGKIHKIDAATGGILLSFGTGGALSNTIYQSAIVRTDTTGTYLYAGERGLSPASLYKFDIRGTVPVFLAEDQHGAIGSNLQDLAIHKGGASVYLACGSPYEIQEINSETITKVNSLSTGPYPNAVTLDPTGLFAYASANSQNVLFKFDLTTKVLLSSETLLARQANDGPQTMGLAVDRTGSKVFIIHGYPYGSDSHYQIQVVSSIPLPDADGDGLPDTADNCPAMANSDQGDLDSDGLGDVCDPYPNDSDNLGACLGANSNFLLQIQTLQSENMTLANENAVLSLENLKLRFLILDDDKDGIYNSFDTCENSPLSTVVDATGCTQKQFCATRTIRAKCTVADWKNDGVASDCVWKNNVCLDRVY